MKAKLYLAAAISALAAAMSSAHALPFSDPRAERIEAMDAAGANQPRDLACRANSFVSAGGQFPRNPHTLALRWGGFANYELVYNGKIILLDAYYDRGSYYQPVGVKAADIKRAAKEEGMTFLREAALAKVFAGKTSLHEINKVTFVE